jgi:hypothetical protein
MTQRLITSGGDFLNYYDLTDVNVLIASLLQMSFITINCQTRGKKKNKSILFSKINFLQPLNGMGSKDLGNKQIDRVQPELNLF